MCFEIQIKTRNDFPFNSPEYNFLCSLYLAISIVRFSQVFKDIYHRPSISFSGLSPILPLYEKHLLCQIWSVHYFSHMFFLITLLYHIHLFFKKKVSEYRAWYQQGLNKCLQQPLLVQSSYLKGLTTSSIQLQKSFNESSISMSPLPPLSQQEVISPLPYSGSVLFLAPLQLFYTALSYRF